MTTTTTTSATRFETPRFPLGEAPVAPTRVVGVGGGTGLSALLRGLCLQDDAASPEDALSIAAIVSVADDGGSTGRLRRHLGIPALGDLRNCLVAMAKGDPLWGEVFQHRFAGGEGLEGHAVGNLIMAALLQSSTDLREAIDRLSGPLGLRGSLLPVSEQAISLCAELEGGGVVMGESKIGSRGRPIRRLWVHPRRPRPARGVLETLAEADLIVLGPGSLYTSILPNLLVDGVPEAIRDSKAHRVFVCNLVTEPGETDGLDARAHLAELERYLGEGVVDTVLLHRPEQPTSLPERYRAAGARWVEWSPADGQPSSGGPRPVFADLAADGDVVRHDPARLARAVTSLGRDLRARKAAAGAASWMPVPAGDYPGAAERPSPLQAAWDGEELP